MQHLSGVIAGLLSLTVKAPLYLKLHSMSISSDETLSRRRLPTSAAYWTGPATASDQFVARVPAYMCNSHGPATATLQEGKSQGLSM
ncbi:hypothetical protein F5Y05DRAFT_382560 [Hypoxylon sp. FL0543]|nr:hypothetical protein F5Y05DRAFT_382560 [Hypoxylon sp. FL0543]